MNSQIRHLAEYATGISASLTLSTITANPLFIRPDGIATSTITVQLKDQAGNAILTSLGTVGLVSTAGILSAVTDHANGTYTAILTSSLLEEVATITGTLNGQALSDTALVGFAMVSTAGRAQVRYGHFRLRRPSLTRRDAVAVAMQNRQEK